MALLTVVCFVSAHASGSAFASDDAAYHTPLAGEPCDIECLGVKVAVPGRNRDNNMALVVGASLFAPTLAQTDFLPIAAFYLKHRWDDTRIRGTFSILVNDFDISRSFGSLQLLGHLDNDTVPFARSETDGAKDIEGTSVVWGKVNSRLGVGLRLPVAPFQIDNDLRLQLFYQTGYLYTKEVAETSPSVPLPRDTLVHGPLFRVRYDGLRRNLMELPHQGVAAGMDTEWMHRSAAARSQGLDETRRYLKLSGYLTAATGLPFLSQRDRFLMSFNGGVSAGGKVDRFSAFRIGGGPIPSESDDLDRQVFPGAIFGQFPVSDYLISALEYRREIFPFLFFHLRGTQAWVKRETFTAPTPTFRWGSGTALSTALTTGFLWESELYLEYSHDSAILRNGSTGGNFFLLWSKSF